MNEIKISVFYLDWKRLLSSEVWTQLSIVNALVFIPA